MKVSPGEQVEVPGLQCPECGGAVGCEVGEWEAKSGRPTEGGLLVFCMLDKDESERSHYYSQSDWAEVQFRAEVWAEENLRVAKQSRSG